MTSFSKNKNHGTCATSTNAPLFTLNWLSFLRFSRSVDSRRITSSSVTKPILSWKMEWTSQGFILSFTLLSKWANLSFYIRILSEKKSETWKCNNSHSSSWHLLDSYSWVFGLWQVGTILWRHYKGHFPLILIFRLKISQNFIFENKH